MKRNISIFITLFVCLFVISSFVVNAIDTDVLFITHTHRDLETSASNYNDAVRTKLQSCSTCQDMMNNRNDNPSFLQKLFNTIGDRFRSGDGTLFTKLLNIFRPQNDDVDVDAILPTLVKYSSQFKQQATQLRQDTTSSESSVMEFSASILDSMSLVLDSVSSQIKDRDTITSDEYICKLMFITNFMLDSYTPNVVAIYQLIDPTVDDTVTTYINQYSESLNKGKTYITNKCIDDNDSTILTTIELKKQLEVLNLESQKESLVNSATIESFCSTVLSFVIGPFFVVVLIILFYFDGGSGTALSDIVFLLLVLPFLIITAIPVIILFPILSIVCPNASPNVGIDDATTFSTEIIDHNPIQEMINDIHQQIVSSSTTTTSNTGNSQQGKYISIDKETIECELELLQCQYEAMQLLYSN